MIRFSAHVYLLLALLPCELFSCTADGLISAGGKGGGGSDGGGGLPPEKDDPCKPDTSLGVPSIVFPATSDFILTEEAVAVAVAESEMIQDEQEIEFQLWLTKKDTTPITKVWTAHSALSQEVTKLNLIKGSFEVGFGDGLKPWGNYAFRVRTRTGEKSECSAGEWSGFRGFRVDDGSERLFDEEVIRDVYISLSDESFDNINAEARPPGCVPYKRSYYPGSVEIDGVTYDNSGVRVKGGCGSARTLSGKASFKINLSDFSRDAMCPETRRASGLKRLTLNNYYQDPSFVHERLAYHLFEKAGVVTPRRAAMRVHVNGELWGLYLHMESVDRRFLNRRFKGNAAKGMLYEGTYECDWTSANLPAADGPATCFERKFSGKCSQADEDGDPYNYAPLIDFIEKIEAIPIDNFYVKIQEIMEFDAFLSHWAIDSIISLYDGTFYNHNNFRVYHNPVSGKWATIPTGLDQSFKIFSLDPWRPKNSVAKRCLEQKECEDAFAKRLKEVLTIFENENLDDLAKTIRTQIRSDVEADPRRKKDKDFDEMVNETIRVIEERPAKIRSVIESHGY